MTEIQTPATMAAALKAYQVLFGENLRSLLARDITSADIDELRQEKHRLMAVLDVLCDFEGWHRADWRVEDGRVICPWCSPGAGRIAGGWHDIASVLVDMPLWQEVLRRATGQEGAQK